MWVRGSVWINLREWHLRNLGAGQEAVECLVSVYKASSLVRLKICGKMKEKFCVLHSTYMLLSTNNSHSHSSHKHLSNWLKRNLTSLYFSSSYMCWMIVVTCADSNIEPITNNSSSTINTTRFGCNCLVWPSLKPPPTHNSADGWDFYCSLSTCSSNQLPHIPLDVCMPPSPNHPLRCRKFELGGTCMFGMYNLVCIQLMIQKFWLTQKYAGCPQIIKLKRGIPSTTSAEVPSMRGTDSTIVTLLSILCFMSQIWLQRL